MSGTSWLRWKSFSRGPEAVSDDSPIPRIPLLLEILDFRGFGV